MSRELAKQTQNAFDFVSKLYYETSYLIKEVEGQLQQEDENFLIGRPSGYAVTTRTSSGLDSVHVEMWFPKYFTVFFVPEALVEMSRGQTDTPLTESFRVLLLHIELHGGHLEQPRVLGGCISHVRSKRANISKFESVMFEFAYNRGKIFDTLPRVSYEDAYCTFEGEFFGRPLYSINSAEDVERLLVRPMIELYRSHPDTI